MRRTKNQTSRRFRSASAFTLIEALVVITVIGVVALLLLPALATPKTKGGPTCGGKLKQVSLAFSLWSEDHNGRYPMQFYTNEFGGALFTNTANLFHYFQVMSNEISNPKNFLCPSDRQRKAATNFTSDFNGTHISYFIGLDASEGKPHSFLAGDSSITNGKKQNDGLMELTTNQIVSWTPKRHDGGGVIAMADGSVQGFSTSGLQQALQKTGFATNRLLMPPSP